MYDFSLLKAKAISKYHQLKIFSELSGMTYVTFHNKEKGAGFKQSEIEIMADLLGIQREDIMKYFFTLKV